MRTWRPSGPSSATSVSRNMSAYLKVHSTPSVLTMASVTSALRTPGDCERRMPLMHRWLTPVAAAKSSSGSGVHIA